MASLLVETNNSLPRSQSSSNLSDLSFIDFEPPQSPLKSDDLPRSASYTYLPIFESSSYTSGRKDYYSADALPTLSTNVSADQKPKEDVKLNYPEQEPERPKLERHSRRQSLVARQKLWINKVKGSPERKQNTEAIIPPQGSRARSPVTSHEKPKLAESFASFARKTWITTSRSPSPSRNIKKEVDDSSIDDDDSTTASSVSSTSPRKTAAVLNKVDNVNAVSKEQSGSPARSWGRKNTLINKTPKRPHSELFSSVALQSFNNSLNSIAKPIDSRSSRPLSMESPPVTKNFAKDTLANLGIETNRRKDELWSAFRSLEGDFQKFQSKSSALKTNVVRASLLPFLRNYAQHPSDKNLRPEDLDRRVNVLNKWWVGILEVLDGGGVHSVSGIDRPVLLEATTAIMTRPEWRLAPSYFAPLNERPSTTPIPRNSSSSSVNSSASQFLAESVYHNVRNTFIQNLLTQMNMVVEKMSLRHAPASLVTFCGKAAAYAFFFCPGVADVLVRIWKLPAEIIRRVADEFGLGRRTGTNNASDEIVAEFPPSLHTLGWTSAKTLAKKLRETPILPVGVSKIPWNGPWVARWCARDSDLFFVFCKHYHILMEDFLQRDAPLVEKVRAPGFVLVHAQILTVLDSTFHREKAPSHMFTAFDEIFSGADASVGGLPLPTSNNNARLMSENRLVMLLRDFLSEGSSDIDAARHTYAETFGIMMCASAKRISLFDSLACFTLCDFGEEVLTIYMRFNSTHETKRDYVDWPFWLTVGRKILLSENSMSEIRLFSFIYTVWNTISSDTRRKEILCLDWILSEKTFLRYFLHWCPMVRAYYMRLLCWRVSRHDGEATELDTKILCRISDNLKLVWSHYQYLKQVAEQNGTLAPSSAPSHPAPGRRILILRSDSHLPQSSLFLGFDGIVSQSQAVLSSGRLSALAGMSGYEIAESNFPVIDQAPRKRWSLLGKIMPFNSPDGPGHGHDAPKAQPTSPNGKMMSRLEEARLATAAARARPPLVTNDKSSLSSAESESPPPETPTFRTYSFRFSLEWNQHTQAQKNAFNQDRRLLCPRLPAPAQTWLVDQVPGTADEVPSLKPSDEYSATAKYSGRALAEWAMIVTENNTFVERRRAEGVPDLKSVEVPTIGIEGLKKWN